MKWIAVVLSIAALGFLYIGTTHRDRCMKAGFGHCTILPWSGSGSLSTAAANSYGPCSASVGVAIPCP